MAPTLLLEIHIDIIWYFLNIKYEWQITFQIFKRHCMIRLQHRTQLIHKQTLTRKWEARCPNQEAAGVTEQCQPLCFHFNSQDEQNSAQVETRFYFSHSSVVRCFQTNSSNHWQLAVNKGTYSGNRMAPIGPCADGPSYLERFSYRQNTYVTS